MWEVWLTWVFNQENANESIIGCNHSLTATVVLVTISLCARNTRVKVRVTERQCRGREDTKCNDRQSYRATISFTGSIFFPFALCCNTRINIFCFRKPTSKDSINCKCGIFEDKYICSFEWSSWSGIRGAMWVSHSLFHKVRKGGQEPAFHRPALLPLQIIYSHTTPKQTEQGQTFRHTKNTTYVG